MVAALRLFGGRNAGTPLAMASMPVSAVQPEEKARSAKKSSARPASAGVARLRLDASSSALSACGGSPKPHRSSPVTIITSTPGDEQVRRDGEGRAGLAHPAQVGRGEQRDQAERDAAPARGLRPGNAEMMLSTPAETDTATVST